MPPLGQHYSITWTQEDETANRAGYFTRNCLSKFAASQAGSAAVPFSPPIVYTAPSSHSTPGPHATRQATRLATVHPGDPEVVAPPSTHVFTSSHSANESESGVFGDFSQRILAALIEENLFSVEQCLKPLPMDMQSKLL